MLKVSGHKNSSSNKPSGAANEYRGPMNLCSEALAAEI